MAIKNVGLLFKEIDNNKELRSKLNSCASRSELIHLLELNHMDFTMDEFEDAFDMLHVKCQTYEAANELFSKSNWFKFLFYSLKN